MYLTAHWWPEAASDSGAVLFMWIPLAAKKNGLCHQVPRAGRAPVTSGCHMFRPPTNSLWKFFRRLNRLPRLWTRWLLGFVCGRRLVWPRASTFRVFRFMGTLFCYLGLHRASSGDLIMQPVRLQPGGHCTRRLHSWPNTESHCMLGVMNHNKGIAVLAFCWVQAAVLFSKPRITFK